MASDFSLANVSETPPANTPVTRPVRLRWFQFRLRTLFVLVTVCAFLAYQGGVWWRMMIAEDAAVAALRERGVGVSNVSGPPGYVPGKQCPPSWFRSLVGRAEHFNATYVDLARIVYLEGKQVGESRQLDDAIEDARDVERENDATDRERPKSVMVWHTVYEQKTKDITPTLDDLRALSQLPHLRQISIGPGLTDDDLQYLSRCESLECIDLTPTEIRGPGLRHLQGLPHLKRLSLRCDFSDSAAWGHVAAISSLEYVSPPFRDDELRQMKGMSNLRSLDLSHGKFSDFGLEVVGTMSSLSSLKLSNQPISNRYLSMLSQLLQLESLDLDGTPISDEGLRAIENLPKLTHLNISQTAITDQGLASVGKAVNLQWLDMSSTRFTDKGIVNLNSLKKLEHLKMINWKVRGTSLRHLETLPLKYLEVFDTDVELDLDAIQNIAKITTLEELSLCAPNVSTENLIPLQRLPALKKLHLRIDKRTRDRTSLEYRRLTSMFPKVQID